MSGRTDDANCDRVVLATPPGRGAVATVIVDGPTATERVACRFRPATGKPLETAAIGRILFGRWCGASDSGEDVVVCRRGDQTIEINCHGGRAASTAITSALAAEGCQETSWQDWHQISAGDAFEAEARIALASAPTSRTATMLLNQLHGALRSEIEGIAELIQAGDSDQAKARLRELDRHSRTGMHLTEPWKVVIAGQANVGKSSLLNAILGYQRSIVFDQPGTTRDVLAGRTAIDGWSVEVTDTAGIRDTRDDLEATGIGMARAELSKADLVLLVADMSLPWEADGPQILKSALQSIIVHNKCDLPPHPGIRPPGLEVSAKMGLGIEQLIESIGVALVPNPPSDTAPIPFSPAQVEAIRSAIELLEFDQLAAASKLRGLLGHTRRK